MKHILKTCLSIGCIIFLCACRSIQVDELTTQPREYPGSTEYLLEKEDVLSNSLKEEEAEEQNEKSQIVIISKSAMKYQETYPDVDFTQRDLKIEDEGVANSLVLKSRYSDDCEMNYSELWQFEEQQFYIRINQASIIKGKENLEEYFITCDRLNDPDYIKMHGKEQLVEGRYLMINVTIRNESGNEMEICMGNKGVNIVYDEIGRYFITENLGGFIDFDYQGENRQSGAKRLYVTLWDRDEVTTNVLYLIEKEIEGANLYYNANTLFRNGWMTDDGIWSSESEGSPNYIQLKIEG